MHSLADVAVNMIQEYMLLCTLEPYGTGVSFVPSHIGSADGDTQKPLSTWGTEGKKKFCFPKEQIQAETDAHKLFLGIMRNITNPTTSQEK